MKAILFLGTSLFGAQYLKPAAEALGFRPIFLLKIDDYSSTPRRAIEESEHYEADVNSIEDILRAIREHDFMPDVVAVTSLLDETLPHACAIATLFGITGPDQALTQLSDKAKIQEMVPSFSPPSLIFTVSDISEHALKNFIAAHDLFNEFMLKPGISSGAVGISILNKTTTIDEIKQLIRASRIEKAERQSWLIQPRIPGLLHSVEGYVKDKKMFFLGFSRRVRKELTEIVTEFPVDTDLPLHLRQKCQETIETLVARSGYENGYFHCEFIINIDSDTTYFIDGNMGRVAGGASVQQLALVYGKNPVDIIRHVIDLGCFRGSNTPDFSYSKVEEERTFRVNYCLAEPAIVLSVTTPDNMTAFHTQVAGNEKEIPEAGSSDSAWVGFIAGFKKNVLEEIKQIKINTNKGMMNPFYLLTENQPIKNE